MTSIFGCSSRNSTSEEIKVRHKEIEETEETTEETEVTVDEDVRSEPSAAVEVKDQVEPASKGNIVKVLVPASLTVACIACAFAVFATVAKKKKQ